MVGRFVIEKLLSCGHEVLNVDQEPLDNPQVHTLKADLTDGAQAFNALSCHFQVSEPFPQTLRTPDAVIHLAGTYWAMFSGGAAKRIPQEKETQQTNAQSWRAGVWKKKEKKKNPPTRAETMDADVHSFMDLNWSELTRN